MRLRYNNQSGSLGASLSSGGTTITFGAAPGFATIVSPDYIPLVLEYGSTTEEIVWLTAYTAGATTGTIVRGQEGSTGISHSSGVSWANNATAFDFVNPLSNGIAYQNGIIASTDLALSSISLNTSTGAITATVAAAIQAIIKDTNGLLIPVTITAGSRVFTPGSLPASTTKYAVYGIEIDTNGSFFIVKGTDSATQLNTGILIAANSPAITSGRLRIADFAIRNVSGTINFSDATTTASQGVNWIDRRPWARGFYYVMPIMTTIIGPAGSNTYQEVSSALRTRFEATGNPFRVGFKGLTVAYQSNGNFIEWGVLLDTFTGGGTTLTVFGGGGSGFSPNIHNGPGSTANQGDSWTMVTQPTAGSHIITPEYQCATTNNLAFEGVGSGYAPVWEVEEVIRPSANNGTV